MKSLKVIDLVLYVFGSLGFENFTAQISLRDKEQGKENTLEVMKTGRKQRALLSTLQQTRTKHSYRIWRSCFYGPKLDFMVKDALGDSGN
jgi:threonyl-tRNA synthetase